MSGIFYKNRPYAGGGSGGGDTVEITPALSAGTKVADYKINGISGALYAPTPATPPDDLNDLSDVAISSPTNGQVLKYNSTSQKWENSTGGGSGSTMYRVLYYNGNTFLNREYVRNGDDALYSYENDQWSLTDGGEPVADIKDNISQDLTLYYASGDLYIVKGSAQISNIEKAENVSGAIVVDVQSDLVKVTSTNNNNGAYGAEIDVTDFDYCVLELDYCTNVYSYFGIGTNFSYSYSGNQEAKAALSNKSSPYRWVVDISSYTGLKYCYISCGGNARFDIKKMFLTNDVYQQGDIT